MLYSLLKSPVKFEITSISIDRPQRLDRGAPGKKAWAARMQRARTAPTTGGRGQAGPRPASARRPRRAARRARRRAARRG